MNSFGPHRNELPLHQKSAPGTAMCLEPVRARNRCTSTVAPMQVVRGGDRAARRATCRGRRPHETGFVLDARPLDRRDPADRRRSQRLDRHHRAGLAAPPRRRHLRDHRRQVPRPTRRQPARPGGPAHRRRAQEARRGQHAASRASGLDARPSELRSRSCSDPPRPRHSRQRNRRPRRAGAGPAAWHAALEVW